MRNSASLDRLVLEHLPAALRLAVRLTGDTDLAEDLVQEALLRAVGKWSSFRGEAAFRTWLFRIIINAFRDRLRQASGRESALDDEQGADLRDASLAAPPELAMAAELERQIASEVSRLPQRQREVLVLIVFEGLPVREVAGIVGISEANVYSTLSVARSSLKLRLAPFLGRVEK